MNEPKEYKVIAFDGSNDESILNSHAVLGWRVASIGVEGKIILERTPPEHLVGCWVNERRDKIACGAWPMKVPTAPHLIIHVIPHEGGSLSPEQPHDLKRLADGWFTGEPFYFDEWAIDGGVVARYSRSLNGYLRLFPSGWLEFVESEMFGRNEAGALHIQVEHIKGMVSELLNRAVRVQSELELAEPIVYVALGGVEGLELDSRRPVKPKLPYQLVRFTPQRFRKEAPNTSQITANIASELWALVGING